MNLTKVSLNSMFSFVIILIRSVHSSRQPRVRTPPSLYAVVVWSEVIERMNVQQRCARVQLRWVKAPRSVPQLRSDAK